MRSPGTILTWVGFDCIRSGMASGSEFYVFRPTVAFLQALGRHRFGRRWARSEFGTFEGAAGHQVEATRLAMRQRSIHWGLHPWRSMPSWGLAVGVVQHIHKGLPWTTALCFTDLGERVLGWPRSPDRHPAVFARSLLATSLVLGARKPTRSERALPLPSRPDGSGSVDYVSPRLHQYLCFFFGAPGGLDAASNPVPRQQGLCVPALVFSFWGADMGDPVDLGDHPGWHYRIPAAVQPDCREDVNFMPGDIVLLGMGISCRFRVYVFIAA